MIGGRRGGSIRVLVVLVVALGLVAPIRVAAADVELTVWSFLPSDDPSMKAYIAAFEEQYPNVSVKHTPFPEVDYADKIRTALSAENPPDIAVIEDRRWMKAGYVVELTPHLQAWGVDPAQFNPGGLARGTPEGKLDGGLYGIGDFLGGNILFYNKRLLDEAGLPHPSATQSMTWTQYDQLCRTVGKPDRNPTKAVYGCSVPGFAFGIWGAWFMGADGRTALGNMNSDPVVGAWNIGTALVRDRYAPSGELLSTLGAGESDLFAQGKLGITWSDFTEATKYAENGIDFGLAPFMVIDGSESFVETYTQPWGTFTDSEHPEEALAFLRFIATDAQRLRAETSSDPPLSTTVTQELAWAAGDPIREQYLAVLQQAKPQVFAPELPEGAFDEGEIYRLLTTGGQTDAKPLLDEAAAKTQPLLDQAWLEWEQLAPDA